MNFKVFNLKTGNLRVLFLCLMFSTNLTQAGKIYLSPGMSSYHFDRDAGYNNENWGLGIQVDFQDNYSLNLGRFDNSENDWSNYVTGTWYPIKFRELRVGILGGGFNGYAKERDGGWFLAAMPIINYRKDGWGVNVAAVPSYKNRIHGAFIFQILFAIY